MDHGVLPQPWGGCRPKSDPLLDRFPEWGLELEVAASAHLTLERWQRLPDVERRLWTERWLRQRETERSVCREHNGPRSECEHHDSPRYPQRRICYFDMERQAAQDQYDALHKDAPYHDGTFTSWSAERSDDEHPYHYSAGVTIYVSPVDDNPDDHFLTRPEDVSDGARVAAAEAAWGEVQGD